MSIEIADMIAFVNEISSLDLNEDSTNSAISSESLRDDEVRPFPDEMRKNVKVDKVEGV